MSRGAPALLKRATLLAVAALLAWRMIAVGLAEHHARRGDAEAAAVGALAWRPQPPQALYRWALAAVESDARAEALLLEAARANPSDGRVYMLLALLRGRQGEREAAERLATTATRLAPMRSEVRLAAAAFWLRQGRLEQALAHWGVALRLRLDARAEVYPVLLRLAEDPATRTVFRPWLDQPPPWWTDFFGYAAANAADLNAVHALYRLGRQDGRRLEAAERRAYLDRLQREGRWLEMYFAWLNDLDASRLAVLGHVVNGGFELPLDNEGFGWRSRPIRGVTVETAATHGADGASALHLVFRRPRAYFRHVAQYLLLDPGGYRLSGRVRIDGLQSASGLRWALRCAGSAPRLLGASEHFLGSSLWRPFETTFTVPAEACRAQELGLELTGRVPRDFEAVGSVWFDSLRIARMSGQGPG